MDAKVAQKLLSEPSTLEQSWAVSVSVEKTFFESTQGSDCVSPLGPTKSFRMPRH